MTPEDVNRVSLGLCLNNIEVNLVHQSHQRADREILKYVLLVKVFSTLVRSCVSSQEFNDLDLFFDSRLIVEESLDNDFEGWAILFAHELRKVFDRQQTKALLNDLKSLHETL